MRVLLPILIVAAGPLSAAKAQAGTDSLADQMQRLRTCESSDNYRANTGNGYYGAYQYAPDTWKRLGYSGRPDHASAKTQDAATTKLHKSQGWKPWPSCARREHLH